MLEALDITESYWAGRVEEIRERFDGLGLQARCRPIGLERLRWMDLVALNQGRTGP